MVVSEPDEREKATRFTVKLFEVIDEGFVKKIQPTKIIISDSLYSQLFYGDEILVRGKIKLPEAFEGDNGRTLEYQKFLAKDKIFFLMPEARVELLDHHKANSVVEILLWLKQKYNHNLDAIIPFPESRLAAGLTIAGKKALPEAILNEFKITGAVQIVVLSGYNITIVSETVISLLAFLPIVWSVICAIVLLVLFTLMAGATATMVRACVMAIVALVSVLFKRTYNVSRALWLTAFIMLLQNPMLLLYDPSFQLSFLSTFGLIVVSPIIEPYLKWIPEKFGIRSVACATFAAQLFVMPYLLYASGDISWVAFPANLLVTLVIPFTMLLAFICGLIGFVSQTIAVPIGLLSFVFLRYVLTIIHVLSQIPGALLSVHSFPLWLMAVVYGCYLVLIRWVHKKS